MASGNDNNERTMDFPTMPSPSTPSPSIPLNLCGFLTGDTVQVQGDTGELQFSVQFNFHKRESHSGDAINFSDMNIPECGTVRDSVESSPSSAYRTPPCEDQRADGNAVNEESPSRRGIVTRLRSGVLSPVKYYPDERRYCASMGGSCSGKKRKANKGRRDRGNVFEKMLKKRSSPLRPCNSYAFFLMANWGVVKHSSFGETSTRLSKKWFRLPKCMKKEYEYMALKDNARYKRQCMLLKNCIEPEASNKDYTTSQT